MKIENSGQKYFSALRQQRRIDYVEVRQEGQVYKVKNFRSGGIHHNLEYFLAWYKTFLLQDHRIRIGIPVGFALYLMFTSDLLTEGLKA